MQAIWHHTPSHCMTANLLIWSGWRSAFMQEVPFARSWTGNLVIGNAWLWRYDESAMGVSFTLSSPKFTVTFSPGAAAGSPDMLPTLTCVFSPMLEPEALAMHSSTTASAVSAIADLPTIHPAQAGPHPAEPPRGALESVTSRSVRPPARCTLLGGCLPMDGSLCTRLACSPSWVGLHSQNGLVI